MHSSGGELVAVNYMIYTRLEDEAMLLKENVASQPHSAACRCLSSLRWPLRLFLVALMALIYISVPHTPNQYLRRVDQRPPLR